MHPEEYINEHDLVQALVFLHDPRKSANPMTEGLPLKAGKYYKIYPTMEQRGSLPPPYSSKCVDYLNEWKKNEGYGPLSKKDCIEMCIMKAMVDSYGCVGQEITYPNNFTMCMWETTVSTSEMLKECYRICGDPCEENIYSFTSQVRSDTTSEGICHPKDELCKSDVLGIQVYFTRMMVQKFQHMPKFESIELFSYMGGYLGMWLGISLASLFDFGEMIYDTVYPFLKGRKKQKPTTPIEKLQQETGKKKKKNNL